jgi:hypothetical protein
VTAGRRQPGEPRGLEVGSWGRDSPPVSGARGDHPRRSYVVAAGRDSAQKEEAAAEAPMGDSC